MNKDVGYTHAMGPQLRAEVERQLFQDFQRYADEQSDDLAIDWSETCPEGHVTEYLDGRLENWSDVWVVNAQGETMARGWMEGGGWGVGDVSSRGSAEPHLHGGCWPVGRA